MNDSNFSHLVEIDETARILRIHRVFPDGRKHFYTETPFPSFTAVTAEAKDTQYADFARLLGENILLDSPVARRLLGI